MLPLRIAFRYLFSKKSTNAINIISWVSMMGMGFGAFALICVLSVFNGFEGLVLSLYNSFYPDVAITAATGKTFADSDSLARIIAAQSDVAAYSRVLEENAYFEYGEEKQLGAIKGVDTHYNDVTQVKDYVRFGDFLLEKDSLQYAVVGANISFPMNINLEQSIEPLRITIPRKGVKTAFVPEDLFTTRSAVPAGIFSIQQEFDSKYVFVSLPLARELTGSESELSAYELKLRDATAIADVKSNLQQKLGTAYKVTGRYEQKAEMYRVMLIERWVTTAILSFIILIISFNIIGSLSMLVLEKGKDISILKAMGADNQLISRVYLLNGLLTSVLGGLAGLGAGYLLCFLQVKFHFLKLGGSQSTFVIDYYPVAFKAADPLIIMGIITGISLAAAYFPARKAGQSAMQFR